MSDRELCSGVRVGGVKAGKHAGAAGRGLLCRSLLAAALLVPAVPAVASAQGPSNRHDVPLAQALHGPAKEAYTSATLLFHNGDFAGAATKYDQAHELSGDPRLLFNMAICEKNLRAYARMQRHLQQFEHDAGSDISQEAKDSADAALAATAELVGSLTVQSNVDGATLTIDGEAVGTMPLASPIVVDLGKHALSLAKPDYQTATSTVDIAGGASSTTTMTLVPEVHTGQISIAAEPGAMISIDGRKVAIERFDGSLDAGHHQVSVSAPGKLIYRADVDLRVSETRTLEVTLMSETKKGPVVWPWIVGGVVVAAGAAVGAYFLFRPSDETHGVPTGGLVGVDFAAWRGR